MKSRDPKQPKERKKSQAKPRQSKSASTSDAVTPMISSPATAIDPHANGAAQPHAVAIELNGAHAGVSDEMIRARAYELFEQRGYEHGHQLDDWLAAERELKYKDRAA